MNRITLGNQLRLNPGRLAELNGQFPQAAFENSAVRIPTTQKLRTSTGLELQVMMPVVNAPFRLYWAYNPTIIRDFFLPPVAADASLFPNQATMDYAASRYSAITPYFEKRTMFRFTISRTF